MPRAGTFALICRVVLVILSCFVIRNFGKGLLEGKCGPSLNVSSLPSRLHITARLVAGAVFHKESTNKMDYDAIPVYVQDDEYAAYETLM
jgi:hypothetical protein